MTPITTRSESFKDFVLKNKENKRVLIVAAAAILAQFSVFKYLYPFASYIHGDSFSYLAAAELNLGINTYMIGYSKFLRLFSVFSKADYVLNAFQYLFIQGSVLFLLYTMFYFYRPRRSIQIILLCFAIFNPLFLHLANLVSSDGFFLALSCLWFALLLWIIHQPSSKVIVWHTVILFITFITRYNALIYPFLAGLAFLLSSMTLRKKIVGISAAFILCSGFIVFTCYEYKKLTGIWQYSPFSGWQWANNAMYAYRYVDSSERKPVPKRFKALDHMVTTYFDKTRDTSIFRTEKAIASTFYMWSPGMPLMRYRDSLWKKDSAAPELKKWASIAPFYKQYGIYIIKQYPVYFLKHFIWPNANKYYAPPIEFLQEYNSDKTVVAPVAQKWFGYSSNKVKVRMGNRVTWVLNIFPVLSGSINITMICLLVLFVVWKGWKSDKKFKNGLILGSSLWLLNAFFTITASSAALRYQSFPLILTTTFVAFLMDWLLIALSEAQTTKDDKPSTLKGNRLQEIPQPEYKF